VAFSIESHWEKVRARVLDFQCPLWQGPYSCSYSSEGQWCSNFTGWLLQIICCGYVICANCI